MSHDLSIKVLKEHIVTIKDKANALQDEIRRKQGMVDHFWSQVTALQGSIERLNVEDEECEKNIKEDNGITGGGEAIFTRKIKKQP